MDKLQADKLTEIKEVMSKITPAPWNWTMKEWTANKYDGLEIGDLEHKLDSKSAELVLCIENNEYGHPVITTGEASNAELIAHAPEYITYLLQLVETQAKALDEAEGMSKRWEKAFVNADKQYLKMEKQAAELRRKLEALTQV